MITTGGPRNSAPGTLNRIFFDAVATYHKPDALQVKRNGRYEPISHDTLAERVRRTALGLEELGVRPGDRVAILSENRPEWAIADFACLMTGVADVPIYPNLPGRSDRVHPARLGRGRRSSCRTRSRRRRSREIRGECPALEHVDHVRRRPRPAPTSRSRRSKRRARRWTPTRDARAYLERANAVRPDDLATIIYTSGTTGEPKGVMLTHDNIYSNVDRRPSGDSVRRRRHRAELPAAVAHLRADGGPLPDVRDAARASRTPSRSTRCRSTCHEVRPTLVLSVPRLYEKMYARVLENALVRRRGQEAHLLLGARRRRPLGRREARRRTSRAGCSRCSTASRRSSCSRSCRRAPADACATSCPAARRSRRRSTSSSTPPGS